MPRLPCAGVLPDCWGNLTAMQELKLSRTQLGGPLPSGWGSLQRLRHLDLSNTRWQPQPAPDVWPRAWANMSSLQYLDLSETTYPTPITGEQLCPFVKGLGQQALWVAAARGWAGILCKTALRVCVPVL